MQPNEGCNALHVWSGRVKTLPYGMAGNAGGLDRSEHIEQADTYCNTARQGSRVLQRHMRY